jgi:hypothetical protein
MLPARPVIGGFWKAAGLLKITFSPPLIAGSSLAPGA